MPTIFSIDGYHFQIYLNDHSPAHVHVRKAEKEARIGLEPIEVLSNEGFNRRELGKILDLVAQYQETLLASWDEYHDQR